MSSQGNGHRHPFRPLNDTHNPKARGNAVYCRALILSTTMMTGNICSILVAFHLVKANEAPPSWFHRRSSWHTSSNNRHDVFDVSITGLPPGWAWGSRNSRRQFSPAALVSFPRGGGDGTLAPIAPTEDATTHSSRVDDVAKKTAREKSLDDRVNAAMRRLGLGDDLHKSSESQQSEKNGMNCEGGVCTLEQSTSAPSAACDERKFDDSNTVAKTDASKIDETGQQDMYEIADRISSDMSVPKEIAMAAISASFLGMGDERRIDEEAARSIVRAEVDAIRNVPEDCEEVSPCSTNLNNKGCMCDVRFLLFIFKVFMHAHSWCQNCRSNNLSPKDSTSFSAVDRLHSQK